MKTTRDRSAERRAASETIELREGDEVVGMEVLDDAKAVLTVSTTGYGRRSEPSDYRLQSRGGKGTINYRTETYGDVAAIAVVDESEDVIFISSDGIIIRIPVSQISTFARPPRASESCVCPRASSWLPSPALRARKIRKSRKKPRLRKCHLPKTAKIRNRGIIGRVFY